MKLTDSRTQARIARILDALLDRDLDLRQLADAVYLVRTETLKPYMAHLTAGESHKRQAHVCGWREPSANGERYPIYRYGRGKNVKRPPFKTQQQALRDWRIRTGQTRPPPAPVAQPFDTLFRL